MTASQQPAAIEIDGLQFAYGAASPPVVDIPRWRVAAGSRLFVHGPSGSGKSTLLNLVGGILSPSQGEIRLLGQPFSSLGKRRRDRFRARHVGMVFQQFNLVPYLGVLDNIRLAGHFAGTAMKEVNDRGKALLAGLGIEPALHRRRASALSIGQQQRVAIARALVNRPEILIVDEPTSALDDAHASQFMAVLLDTLAGSDTTLLFVSHDRRLVSHFPEALDLRALNRGESH